MIAGGEVRSWPLAAREQAIAKEQEAWTPKSPSCCRYSSLPRGSGAARRAEPCRAPRPVIRAPAQPALDHPIAHPADPRGPGGSLSAAPRLLTRDETGRILILRWINGVDRTIIARSDLLAALSAQRGDPIRSPTSAPYHACSSTCRQGTSIRSATSLVGPWPGRYQGMQVATRPGRLASRPRRRISGRRAWRTAPTAPHGDQHRR